MLVSKVFSMVYLPSSASVICSAVMGSQPLNVPTKNSPVSTTGSVISPLNTTLPAVRSTVMV